MAGLLAALAGEDARGEQREDERCAADVAPLHPGHVLACAGEDAVHAGQHVEREAAEVQRAPRLLADTRAAAQQAEQGLCTVLKRHTCHHRAEQLTSIFEEVCR